MYKSDYFRRKTINLVKWMLLPCITCLLLPIVALSVKMTNILKDSQLSTMTKD